MKAFLVVALFLITVSGSAAAISSDRTMTLENASSSISKSSFILPEAANRKGSKRIGGSNSKGKGSHYRGGHR